MDEFRKMCDTIISPLIQQAIEDGADQQYIKTYKDRLYQLANDGAIQLYSGKVAYIGPGGIKETLEEEEI